MIRLKVIEKLITNYKYLYEASQVSGHDDIKTLSDGSLNIISGLTDDPKSSKKQFKDLAVEHYQHRITVSQQSVCQTSRIFEEYLKLQENPECL